MSSTSQVFLSRILKFPNFLYTTQRSATNQWTPGKIKANKYLLLTDFLALMDLFPEIFEQPKQPAIGCFFFFFFLCFPSKERGGLWHVELGSKLILALHSQVVCLRRQNIHWKDCGRTLQESTVVWNHMLAVHTHGHWTPDQLTAWCQPRGRPLEAEE